jgi:hypothetical protein
MSDPVRSEANDGCGTQADFMPDLARPDNLNRGRDDGLRDRTMFEKLYGERE